MPKNKIVKNLVKVNQEEVQDFLKKQVKDSVEATLNTMLDSEADALCGAEKKVEGVTHVSVCQR
jgi:hypothetical protein